jgi:atypical dual specificity phosphatase
MSANVFQELKVRAQLDPIVRRKLIAYPLQFLANFDLSFDEKRQIVLPRFSWILEERLAAMPFPSTEDAYVMLQQLGIKVILNLTGYVDDAPLLSPFTAYHIPIANQKPPTLHEMHQAVSIIQVSLKSSQPVVVHCEAGLGRTGTIIAGYLTTGGLAAQEAIDSMRKLRPGSIETEEQEAVIYEYERIHRALLEGSHSKDFLEVHSAIRHKADTQ